MMQYISGLCRTLPVMATGFRVTAFRRAARRAVFVLGAAILLLASPLPASAQRGVRISYLEDPAASFRIEDVASQEKSGDFRGYIPSFMVFSRLPGAFNGAIWLKITLDTAFERPVTALTVDLGTALPGFTRLFIPLENGAFSVMENAPPGGVFTLPENIPFPDTLYVRIDGVPGLWFRPQLEAAHEGAGMPPLHFILAGLFAFGMLILLVQYVRKAEEWRVWAAITAGCGIIAAVLPPIPSAGAAFTPLVATGMLMPGLILTLFIHTARHLFDAPRTMPGYDKLLILLYLVGGGIALLPLIPGFLRVTPYLPLAYIALLPLLPLAMVALARSLRGCSLFFCACLLPIAGVAASAWELTTPGTSWLGGNGGLWGLALAILIISFAGPDKAKAETADEEDVFDSLNRSHERALSIKPRNGTPGTKPASPAPVLAEAPASSLTDAPVAAFGEAPLEAFGTALPNLPGAFPEPDRHEAPATDWAAHAETPHEAEFPSLSLFGGNDDEDTEPEPVDATPPVSLAPEISPVPEMFTEPAPIPPAMPDPVAPAAPVAPVARTARAEMPLPAEPPATPAPETATAVLAVPGVPTAPVETPALFTEDGPEHAEAYGVASHDEDAHVPAQERRMGRRILFNLPLLIKNAYDALAPLSERKNVGMTWFIAPQTGRLFEGDAELLESALRLLLRDMVESVDQGNVRLNVRRLPDSAEGHLVFTVVEWDAKQISSERKIAGLAEAWSLAEKTGGIFSVEHSPSGGTTVIFSTIFTAMDGTGQAEGEAPGPVGKLANARPNARANAGSGERNSAEETPDEQPTPIQVFTDYPDIALPEAEEDLSATHAAGPTGINADALAGERSHERDPRRIIVADVAATSRARTAAVFAETPYSVLECASPTDALALYADLPSALVVMNADMPEMDIIAAVKGIRADDEAHGRSPAPAVVLVGYAEQAKRLMRAGCTRSVKKSVLEDDLLAIVKELIPIADAPAMAEAPAPRETPALPQTEPPLPEEPDQAPTPEIVLDVALTDIPSMESEQAEAGKPEAQLDTGTYSPIEESGIFSSVLPPDEPGTPENAQPEKTPEEPQPQPAKPSLGLGLLDMIITDEEPEETPPAPAAPETPPAPQAKPKKGVRVVVRSGNTAKQPPAEKAAPSSGEETGTGPVRKDQVQGQPQGQGQTPNGEAAARVRQMTGSLRSTPPVPVSVPLPSEEDSVFKDMVPLIPGLIVELADSMNDAARGREEKKPMLVQEAAERVAGKAESFGLARLERMARCVERAAPADDIEPMECVLADLEVWVARYMEALQQLHRTQQW